MGEDENNLYIKWRHAAGYYRAPLHGADCITECSSVEPETMQFASTTILLHKRKGRLENSRVLDTLPISHELRRQYVQAFKVADDVAVEDPVKQITGKVTLRVHDGIPVLEVSYVNITLSVCRRLDFNEILEVFGIVTNVLENVINGVNAIPVMQAALTDGPRMGMDLPDVNGNRLLRFSARLEIQLDPKFRGEE